MIKKKLLCGKTFRSNINSFSDPDLFRYITSLIQPEDLTCPHCKQKGSFVRMSSYSRSLIYVGDGARKEEEVDVTNLQCSCGRWHAVLSDVLIPFGSYSFRFILYVLEQYLHRDCSVADLCDKWQISVSTLYGWIHRFVDHFSLWAGAMRTIRWVTQQALDEVCSYVDFADAFLERFLAFSFLQGYPVPDSRPRPASADPSRALPQ